MKNRKDWSYVVVEYSGRDNETEIRRFKSMTEAFNFMKRQYEEDELQDLDVMIAVDRGDGELSYDY